MTFFLNDKTVLCEGDFSRVTEAEVTAAVARPRIVHVLGDNSDIGPMNEP